MKPHHPLKKRLVVVRRANGAEEDTDKDWHVVEEYVDAGFSARNIIVEYLSALVRFTIGA